MEKIKAFSFVMLAFILQMHHSCFVKLKLI